MALDTQDARRSVFSVIDWTIGHVPDQNFNVSLDRRQAAAIYAGLLTLMFYIAPTNFPLPPRTTDFVLPARIRPR